MEWKGKNMICRAYKLTSLLIHTELKKLDKIVIIENKPEKKKLADRSRVLSCKFLFTKIISSYKLCRFSKQIYHLRNWELSLMCGTDENTAHLLHQCHLIFDWFFFFIFSRAHAFEKLKLKFSKVSQWVSQEKQVPVHHLVKGDCRRLLISSL